MKVLMLLDNPFIYDERAYREAKTIVTLGMDLLLIATKSVGLPDSEIINGIKVSRIIEPELFKLTAIRYRKKLAKMISCNTFDIIHCYDQFMLDLGVKIKKRKPGSILIYKSRELYHEWPLNISKPGNIINWLKSYLARKYFVFREKLNAKHIDYLITVNDSLASILGKYFHLSRPVVVVRNIGESIETGPFKDIVRNFFKISSDTKILLYSGANIYLRSRNLEKVIQQFGDKKNIALVFICGEGGHKHLIKNLVKEKGYCNIFFHDIVKPSELISYIASCDVGVVPMWNKKDLSYWYALDNKLFDYINGEIPILATQQPEYVKIVTANQIGICVNPDIQNAYYEGFNKIIANHSFFKRNVTEIKNVLNWENEQGKLVDLYSKLLK